MAKQGVVPDALTQPFWDAANEGRLVIQHCHACDRLQHPRRRRVSSVAPGTIWRGRR